MKYLLISLLCLSSAGHAAEDLIAIYNSALKLATSPTTRNKEGRLLETCGFNLSNPDGKKFALNVKDRGNGENYLKQMKMLFTYAASPIVINPDTKKNSIDAGLGLTDEQSFEFSTIGCRSDANVFLKEFKQALEFSYTTLEYKWQDSIIFAKNIALRGSNGKYIADFSQALHLHYSTRRTQRKITESI